MRWRRGIRTLASTMDSMLQNLWEGRIVLLFTSCLERRLQGRRKATRKPLTAFSELSRASHLRQINDFSLCKAHKTSILPHDRNLSRVLHNRSDQLATLHDRLQLLGHGLLLKDALLLSLNGQTDVDGTSFGGDDLDVERFLGEVDLPAVGAVDEDRGHFAEDLDGEGGGGGNGQGGDGRVEEKGDLGAVDY